MARVLGERGRRCGIGFRLALARGKGAEEEERPCCCLEPKVMGEGEGGRWVAGLPEPRGTACGAHAWWVAFELGFGSARNFLMLEN